MIVTIFDPILGIEGDIGCITLLTECMVCNMANCGYRKCNIGAGDIVGYHEIYALHLTACVYGA